MTHDVTSRSLNAEDLFDIMDKLALTLGAMATELTEIKAMVVKGNGRAQLIRALVMNEDGLRDVMRNALRIS